MRASVGTKVTGTGGVKQSGAGVARKWSSSWPQPGAKVRVAAKKQKYPVGAQVCYPTTTVCDVTGMLE